MRQGERRGWHRWCLQQRVVLAAALVAALGPGPGATVRTVLAAETATVVGSQDGVFVRENPAHDGEVLGALPDGTTVHLRTDVLDTVLAADGATRWWPVETAAGEGWISGSYLAVDGWAAPDPPAAAPDAVAGSTGEPLLTDGMARVSDPDGVNVRAEPGLSGDRLGVVGHGEVVELRSGTVDTVHADGSRWWPVTAEGLDGWISGDYLEPVATNPPLPAPVDPAGALSQTAAMGEPGDPDPATRVARGAAVLEEWAAVATDDGAGLNIRADAAPNAERVGGLPERTVVRVMDGPSVDPLGNPWYLVTEDRVTGWVFGEFLRPADEPREPPAAAATDVLRYPVERFQFTQGFGCSPYWWNYAYDAAWGCNVHNGLDLAAPSGTPVAAAADGVVEQAGWCDCGLGYYVKIDHGDGLKTVYGHMSEYYAAAGDAVAKGDTIGAMGSTGNSTGPHVHFTVEVQGVDQDPLLYLP